MRDPSPTDTPAKNVNDQPLTFLLRDSPRSGRQIGSCAAGLGASCLDRASGLDATIGPGVVLTRWFSPDGRASISCVGKLGRGKAMAMATTTTSNGEGSTAAARRKTAAAAARKAKVVPHLSVAERVARGKAARAEVPRSSHGVFEPSPTRADPVELLELQAKTRVPELVPIRYGRMLVSPFTFYRGAALIMAQDLSATPRSGLSCAVLRGRAPVELRGVRVARAPAGVRSE